MLAACAGQPNRSHNLACIDHVLPSKDSFMRTTLSLNAASTAPKLTWTARLHSAIDWGTRHPSRDRTKGRRAHTAASAVSRSAMRSPRSSMPIESRTASSPTPACSSSARASCRCVVEAGCVASERTSPILTRRVKSRSASRKRAPFSRPLSAGPLTPKLTRPDALPERYFLTRRWSGWSSRPA